MNLLAIILGLGVVSANAAESREMLEVTKVTQGLCLVIDESSGELTSALASHSRLYVQGCVRDSNSVERSRKVLVAAGVVHRASIILREADHLPYSDNLINLIVIPDWPSSNVDVREVFRVMAPGGMAVIGHGNERLTAALPLLAIETVDSPLLPKWTVLRKPFDSSFGDWTHFKGGADQSYVSNDTAVAPWKEIRWIGDPRWGSLYTSYGGFVSGGGRIYYKENRSAEGGNQWFLVARDAFNGSELWRVKSGAAWKKTHHYNDYTLTCDESRVFLTEDDSPKFPAYNGRLVSRDGKTGELLARYSLKFSPRTVTASGASLIASTRNTAAALDKKSGNVLWEGDCNDHPAAVGNTMYVVYQGFLQAIELPSGRTLWKSQVDGLPVKPRYSYKIEVKHKGEVAYVVSYNQYGAAGQVAAFDAKQGNALWRVEKKFSHGVLPFTDEVWCMHRENRKNNADNMFALVLDSRTGKTKREFMVQGHVMSKCWGARASANQIMYSNGWYLNRHTGESEGHPSTRSPCAIGQNPANGLTYFMPHHCDCKVSIRGFLALAKPGVRNWLPDANHADEYRLIPTAPQSAKATAVIHADDWPVYRKDSKRSNASSSKLPDRLKPVWTQKLGETDLTQATIAYGRVFSAEQRAGRVHCLDAKTGEAIWSFVADGRVEFPPTLHRGICLVATCAGTVYALDASGGQLLWRLRAAPTQKFIADRNQFASSWPVIGGVLVVGDTAYFSVGRTRSQLGGLWLFAIDPTTGKVRWRVEGGSSGDMFVADDQSLVHTARVYAPDSGKQLRPRRAPLGILQTTRYLSTVSIADYIATVEPSLSHKKHIQLTDGRIKGDCISFDKNISIAGSRYTPGVPGWKDKDKTNKFFIHAKGSNQWNLHDVHQHMHSILVAGESAYMAGAPTSNDGSQPCELWVLSAKDGGRRQTIQLNHRPVYDGLSASQGRLYLSTEAGELICFGAESGS